MKYIRTKDGRVIKAKAVEYNLVDRDDTFIQRRRDFIDILHRAIPQERVLKEADTIEELCDEFVYLFEGHHFYCRWNKLIKKWQTLPELFEMSDDKIKTIKGAIWTNKGLIYVAKMNNKGELELL